MANEPKAYEGAERHQMFVKRYERNPNLGAQTPRGGYDQRPYRMSEQWSYCVGRHRDYWRARGFKDRCVPHYRHEGEDGWWFPEVWVVEYVQAKQRKRLEIVK
jgi:hypothetical protein